MQRQRTAIDFVGFCISPLRATRQLHCHCSHIRNRPCPVSSRIKPRLSIQVRLRCTAARLASVRASAIGAQMLRHGWFKSVHAKSADAQEIRTLLTARKLLTRKRADLDIGMRGILRSFGLKVGQGGRARFDARLRELIAENAMLEKVIGALLDARAALARELVELHRAVLRLTRESEVCKRLMSVPGVGPVASLTFVAAVDDPHRFRSSKAIGAHFGLTPRKYQSGEVDVTGHITKAGDASVRTVLYEAANAIITLRVKPSALKT